MQAINTSVDLKRAISQLELQKAAEKKLLSNELSLFIESLSPETLIKKGLSKLTHSEGVKNQLINAGIGLTTGYITKAAFQKFPIPFKKTLGTALMLGVTSMVSKNPGAIINLGKQIYGMFGGKRKSDVKAQARTA